MLNPSKADSRILDATVRRCIDYAKRWGYRTLEVGNIFALKSTDPALLYSEIDPVGPENDQAIRDIYAKADLTIAAWGTHGIYLNRGNEVLKLIPEAKCLVQTKEGQPGHPLSLKLWLIELLHYNLTREVHISCVQETPQFLFT